MFPAGKSGLQRERAALSTSSRPAGEPRYVLPHTAAPHTQTGNEAVGRTAGAWEGEEEEERREGEEEEERRE